MFLISVNAFEQVGINTASPYTSTSLELASAKGTLPEQSSQHGNNKQPTILISLEQSNKRKHSIYTNLLEIMKKQLLPIAILLAVTGTVKSQIAIGKPTVTNTSVSLEFADTENRGFVLPYVETKTGITDNGTIIYDTTDYKVKYLKDSGTWTDLSVDDTGAANILIQTNKIESTTAKSVIGSAAATDSTPGILILSDTDKAMILPKVASPHLNIIDPAPGLMAYDTVKRQLAVYNGTVWTFWKP